MTRCLLVDPSASIRGVLRRAILATGEATDPEVFEASGPDEAERLFEEKKPEFVFTDVTLRETHDGLAVIGHILRDKPDAHLVVVSAFPKGQDDVCAAFGLGAFSYVEKPVRNDSLRRVFREYHYEEGRAGRIR
ncbi:MAG: response regulator [Thermoplasmatota archaeon]